MTATIALLAKNQAGLSTPDELQTCQTPKGPLRNTLAMPLEQALEQEHEDDAHFVTYRVVGEEAWPRIKKPAVSWLQKSGADIVVDTLVLDLDLPGHRSWEDLRLQFEDAVGDIVERASREPLLLRWQYLYRTRAGIRVIYVLDEPLSVDVVENHHYWLVKKWQRAGAQDLEIDTACSDWTRLFRLPKVIREGKPSWKGEHDELLIVNDEAAPLKKKELGSEDKPKGEHKATGKLLGAGLDIPTPESCHEALYTGENNKMTEWHKAAKKRLRGRECYPYLFEDASLEEGSRDTNLTRYVGQACTMLANLELCTPQRVYALFYELACTIEDHDTENTDWLGVVWEKVLRFYEEAEVHQSKREVEQEARAEAAIESTNDVLDVVRTWAPKDAPIHPDAEGNVDLPAAFSWVSRRLFLSAGKYFYVMDESGYYGNETYDSSELIPHIRTTEFLSNLIDTYVETENGISDVSATTIINNHSLPIGDTVSECDIPGGWVEEKKNGKPVLHLPLYQLNHDLGAEFNQDVDDWLRAFFGEQYERGTEWIGHALDFAGGPICALSIRGGAGAGKKLLLEGLKECLVRPAMATSEDLIGDWGYGLLASPFIAVNEGWPKRSGFKCHPSDAFRRLVGGDGATVQLKNKPPVTVRSPFRVIFAANNDDVVKELSYGKTLSPEDRDALAVRLLHMDIGDTASLWLKKRGGRTFTDGWICGDGGKQGKFTIAKHFLWLYENRTPSEGQRLLVEGCTNSSIVDEMRVTSGLTPLIAETIVGMLKAFKPDQVTNLAPGMEGIARNGDGGIHLTNGGVLTVYRNNLQTVTRESLTSHQVRQALEVLCSKVPKFSSRVRGAKNDKKCRWYELDLFVLLKVAEAQGWDATPVEEAIDNLANSEHMRKELMDRTTAQDVFGIRAREAFDKVVPGRVTGE